MTPHGVSRWSKMMVVLVLIYQAFYDHTKKQPEWQHYHTKQFQQDFPRSAEEEFHNCTMQTEWQLFCLLVQRIRTIWDTRHSKTTLHSVTPTDHAYIWLVITIKCTQNVRCPHVNLTSDQVSKVGAKLLCSVGQFLPAPHAPN